MACSRSEIIEVFRRFISSDDEIDAIEKGKPIMSAISIDSLTMVHLVTDLEKTFNTRFDYETIEYVFETIHTLETFLCDENKENS